MAGFTLDLTAAKKKEVQKTVKDLMKKKGIEYDEWLAQQELNYLLDNISSAIAPRTNHSNTHSH